MPCRDEYVIYIPYLQTRVKDKRERETDIYNIFTRMSTYVQEKRKINTGSLSCTRDEHVDETSKDEKGE